MAGFGLFLHLGSAESLKTQEQKVIFQIGTLSPHGINERFSFNKVILVFSTTTQNSSNRSVEGPTLETSVFQFFTVASLRYQLSY